MERALRGVFPLALMCLLLVLAPSAPVAAGPTAALDAPNAQQSGGEPRAVVTADPIRNAPGEVRITVTYENVDPSAGLKLALPCTSSCSNEDANTAINKGATLLSSDGFASSSESKWDLELDRSTFTGTASVTYRVGGNFTGSSGATAVDTGDWAWLPATALAPATDRPVEAIARSKGDIYSDRYLVAGDVQVRRELIHGQHVRFVMHPEQSFPRIARAYARTLRNVSYDLRVGGRDANLTLWLTWGAGGSGNEAVINGLGNRDGLVHEYFHTRQGYTLPSSRRMCDNEAAGEGCATWFFENPPELYQRLYREKTQGTVTAPGPTPDDLADDTYNDPPLDHLDHPTRSGRAKRTLLALDWLIRGETSGDKSVQHLIRRLNEHARERGPVNHTAFEGALATVTGSPQSSFVRQYVEARNVTVPNSTLPPRSRLTDALWNGSGRGGWNTSLALSADPEQIPPWTTQVTFTLTNTGTDPSIGHATHLRPAGPWRVGSATAGRGWYNGSSDTWHVPDLSAGESTTLTVTLASPPYDVGPPNVTARVTDSDGNVDTAAAEGMNISNPQPPILTPGATLSNLRIHTRSPRAGQLVPVTVEASPTGPSATFDATLLAERRVIDRKPIHLTGTRTIAFGPSFPTPGDRPVWIALFNRSGSVVAAVQPETVVVRNASVPVAIAPDRQSAVPGETETFNLTVGDVPNGVGRYAVDLAVNDSSVANITGLDVIGGSGTTGIRADGEAATIDASGLRTGNGTVRIARVNLTGRQRGWVTLSVGVKALGDEDGNGYDVASTGVAAFHVRPPGSTGPSPGYVLPPEEVEGLECPAEVCDAPVIGGYTDDEVALLRIETSDGVQHFRARVLDRRVTAFEPVPGPGAVDQTVTVRTDAETARAVWTADDPVAAAREALEADRITVGRDPKAANGDRPGPATRVPTPVEWLLEPVFGPLQDVLPWDRLPLEGSIPRPRSVEGAR